MRLNHLGEREYQTYRGWLRAIRKIDANAEVRIAGNSDIAFAIASNKRSIGEWYGDCGVIYANGDNWIPMDF